MAGEFFSIQNDDNKNYRGIVTECNEVLKEWNITNVTAYTKKQWSRFMKQKISFRNKDELIITSQGYKKINTEDYKDGPLDMKQYIKDLNLASARIIFRRNCRLLQSVQLNFKSDPRYKSGNYLCIQCLALVHEVRHQDSQEALLGECEANSDLRQKYNLRDIQQEADFYKDILERRNQLGEG